MSPNPTSPETRFPAGVYRWVLKLYPAAFRQRYEDEMLRIFREEWNRAAGEGGLARVRYALHLGWDIFHTVPREWSMVVPRLALMTFAAAVLATVYISFEPISLLLKALIWAALTGTVSVAVAVASGRTRVAQVKLGALGLLFGLMLAPFLGLNPKLASPPQGPLVPVTNPSLTGREIFRRMEAVYRSARTYRDEGEVQTVNRGFRMRTGIETFSTAFVRNGGFRFGFRNQFDRLDSWNEYVIWQDGPMVKSWWTLQPRVASEKTLDNALGGAAGVSGLASVMVPELLQPGKMRGSFLSNRSAEITLLGTQRLDGVETFKLQMTAPRGPLFTLWIDAGSYLIERISHSNPLLGTELRVDETIVYHPHLNVPVGASALVFQPGPVPTGRRWLSDLLVGGQTYAMFVALGVNLVMTLLNFIHGRMLRKRWWGKKELWVASVTKRVLAGYVCIFATCIGMWLGGVELDGVFRNLMLAQFMAQGFFMLYVIHRRSQGHARFAAA